MNATENETVEQEDSEINMTPMLDVVFILLIFFIVAAVFIREPGIDVDRPAATTTREQTTSVYIAISNENAIWIDGSEIEADNLRYEIEKLHAENPGGGVVIQADARSRNETTLAVMDAAKAAGIDSVIIATQRL